MKTILIALAVICTMTLVGCENASQCNDVPTEPTEAESYNVASDFVMVSHYDYSDENVVAFPYEWTVEKEVIEKLISEMEYEEHIAEESDFLWENKVESYSLYGRPDFDMWLIKVDDVWYIERDDSWLKIKNTFNIPEGKKLTMDDLLEIAKKGEEMTSLDFAKYKGHSTGFGLVILNYYIDAEYMLSIGMGSGTEPIYMKLYSKTKDESIDIRYDSVEEFIK